MDTDLERSRQQIEDDLRILRSQLDDLHTQIDTERAIGLSWKDENDALKEKITLGSAQLTQIQDELTVQQERCETLSKEKYETSKALAKSQEKFKEESTRNCMEMSALRSEKERLEKLAIRFNHFLKNLGRLCGLPETVLEEDGHFETLLASVKNLLQKRSQENKELQEAKIAIEYYRGLCQQGLDYPACMTKKTAPAATAKDDSEPPQKKGRYI